MTTTNTSREALIARIDDERYIYGEPPLATVSGFLLSMNRRKALLDDCRKFILEAHHAARGDGERPDEDCGWPDNICADRHETTGKWVLHYLTDKQAKACKDALTRIIGEQNDR